jgi:hypothetical protein
MLSALATLALAPVRSGAANPLRLVYVIGILILLVLALGLIALHLRKRLLADDAADASAGSLLEQMRGMLKRGEITQAEFDSMRRRMVERMSATSLSNDDASLRPPISRPRPAAPGERLAPPGFDLTGQPRPRPSSPPAASPRDSGPPPPPHPPDKR